MNRLREYHDMRGEFGTYAPRADEAETFDYHYWNLRPGMADVPLLMELIYAVTELRTSSASIERF